MYRAFPFGYSSLGKAIGIVLTRLLIGPYHLPRLQEIVVSEATAKIMALHDKFKT